MSESIYDAMRAVEQRRCESDILYRILVDESGDVLKPLCRNFVAQIRAEHATRSKRLDRILDEICTTDDRIALHGFLFFCLRKSEWAVNEILRDASAPPDKVSAFVMNILPRLTDQLLRGGFTSLRSYVEETRWQYCML